MIKKLSPLSKKRWLVLICKSGLTEEMGRILSVARNGIIRLLTQRLRKSLPPLYQALFMTCVPAAGPIVVPIYWRANMIAAFKIDIQTQAAQRLKPMLSNKKCPNLLIPLLLPLSIQ